MKELGVGITLLPHAMCELTRLGLGEALARQGIENGGSCFFNRFGQLVYAEPRGRAGYPIPEVGIHRGRAHLTLWNAAVERLGADRVLADHQCVGVEQTDRRVTLRFRSAARDGGARPPVEADVAVAVGDRPFADLAEHISQAELHQLSNEYKRVAGFGLDDVAFTRARYCAGIRTPSPRRR